MGANLKNVCLAVFSLLFSAAAQTAPQDLPLIQKKDIAHSGSFRLPDGTFGASRFGYGGRGICHYKDPGSGRHTLFMEGHAWFPGNVAQVEVPSLGETATVLQNFSDATDGRLDSLASSGSFVYGMLAYNNRLIIAASCYYDGDGSQVNSHGASPLSLSATNDFKGFYPMLGAANARSKGGYMTTIPAAWQPLLGGPALTGKGCLSIISNNGCGPCATVFNPDDVGVKNPIPGTTLLFYPLSHPLRPESSSNEYFNLATHMAGIAFPNGSRSVLFFGRQGTGTYCYGEGSVCGDRCDDSKGTHAFPYRYQVWAYDAADLLQVKNGAKQTWEIQPYAIWSLDGIGGDDSCADMEAAAYDPETGRLYVSPSWGEEPAVHVFQITVPGASVMNNSASWQKGPALKIRRHPCSQAVIITVTNYRGPNTHGTVTVFNPAGDKIDEFTLPANHLQPAASLSVSWDTAPLPQGMYIVHVRIGTRIFTGQIALTR